MSCPHYHTEHTHQRLTDPEGPIEDPAEGGHLILGAPHTIPAKLTGPLTWGPKNTLFPRTRGATYCGLLEQRVPLVHEAYTFINLSLCKRFHPPCWYLSWKHHGPLRRQQWWDKAFEPGRRFSEVSRVWSNRPLEKQPLQLPNQPGEMLKCSTTPKDRP